MLRALVNAVYKPLHDVRKHPAATAAIYLVQNAFCAVTGFAAQPVADAEPNAPHGKLAMCLRFRDEACYLREWLDYYIAAGVDHFFLYNNFSMDDFESVLRPYQDRGIVTLIDWPLVPASPAAEDDCLRRTRGRFEWVGFFDADEFVVVADNSSLPDFLDCYSVAPGVALHWYYFGSSGHEKRPQGPVIGAFTRRAKAPNRHFKLFVRPDATIRNRNSHCFYFRWGRLAVREDNSKALGSMRSPAIAARAWVNHYYFKSLEDYLEKSARKSTLDVSGIKEPSRQAMAAQHNFQANNEVVDARALNYYITRKAVSAPIPRDPS